MKTKKKTKNSWGGSQFLWSFHPMSFNCTSLLPMLHYRIDSFLMKKQYLCIDIMFSKKKKIVMNAKFDLYWMISFFNVGGVIYWILFINIKATIY